MHDLKQQKHKLELQWRLTRADREDGGQSRETNNRTRKRVNGGGAHREDVALVREDEGALGRARKARA
jgi:hypothetical protein